MAATSSDVQSKIAQSTVCFSIFLPAGDRSKTYHIEFFFEKNDLSQSVFGVSVSEFGKILSQDIQLERLMFLGCYHGTDRDQRYVKHEDADRITLNIPLNTRAACQDALAVLESLFSLMPIEIDTSESGWYKRASVVTRENKIISDIATLLDEPIMDRFSNRSIGKTGKEMLREMLSQIESLLTELPQPTQVGSNSAGLFAGGAEGQNGPHHRDACCLLL